LFFLFLLVSQAAIDNACTMEEIQALEKQLAVITQQQQQ
jgi:hypothetical protein